VSGVPAAGSIRATIWFQPAEAHDIPRQRWHLGLRIPPEVVEDRIAAAIEAAANWSTAPPRRRSGS
jgi:hypothetical protein